MYCTGGKKYPCKVDTFTSEDGSFCEQCLPGYECKPDGSKAKCPEGKFNNGTFVGCYWCPDGTYQDVPGSTFCKTCLPGTTITTNSITGVSKCKECPKGTYNTGTDNKCSVCAEGTYQDKEGQTACKMCKDGESPELVPEGPVGSTKCKPCSDGNICEGGTEKDCPAGKQCKGGKVDDCPLGTYSDGGLSECKKCSKDTFNNKKGSKSVSDCQSCDNFQTTLHEGSESRLDCGCKEGYVMEKSADVEPANTDYVCSKCDLEKFICGTFNLTASDMKPAQDFFMIPDSNGKISVYECPVGNCMKGGGCNSAGGYEGFLCSTCKESFFKQGSIQSATSCGPCNPLSLIVTESFFSLLFGFISLGYTIYSTLGTLTKLVSRKSTVDKSPVLDATVTPVPLHSLALKLSLSHLQVLGIVGNFNFSWPSSLASLFATSDVLGSLNIQYLTAIFERSSADKNNTTNSTSVGHGYGGGVKCLVGSMTHGHDVPLPMTDMLVNLGVLILNGICVSLFWLAYAKYKKHSSTYLHQRLVISMTVLLYTMYPNFTHLFFQLLSCKSYPPEERRRLQGSLDTFCFEANHWFWIWRLALPVFALIIMAWPLASFLKLNHLRRTKVDGLANSDVVSTLGFLYDGFHLDFWYWEMIVLTRKICLSVVSVFLSTSTDGDAALYRQGMAALFIMGTSLCVHLSVYPYMHLQINRLETLGLTVSALTLYGGMLTFDNAANQTAKEIISSLVMGMNLMWLLFVLQIMYSGLKVQEKLAKLCCCRKSKKKEGSDDFDDTDKVRLEKDEKGAKVKGDSSKKGKVGGKVMNDIEMAPVHVSNPLLSMSQSPEGGRTSKAGKESKGGIPSEGGANANKQYDRVMINPLGSNKK